MKKLIGIAIYISLISNLSAMVEPDNRTIIKNAYKSAICTTIYGGKLDNNECMIHDLLTDKTAPLQNIYHFWKAQTPSATFFKEVVNQFQTPSEREQYCSFKDPSLYGVKKVFSEAAWLLCDLTKNMFKKELTNLSILFQDKNPPFFNFVTSNVLFPLLPLSQPKSVNPSLDPVQETATLVISKAKKATTKTLNRVEFAHHIVEELLYPLLIIDPNHKYVLNPINHRTVEKRMDNLFGSSQYSTCINQAHTITDPISKQNKIFYCHFLKKSGNIDNKAVLSNFIQLLALNQTLIQNTQGCLDKDMLQYQYEIEKDIQKKKQGYFIAWTINQINPKSKKSEVKTNYYKLNCITKFTETSSKQELPTKTPLNGFYQLIQNFDQLLKVSDELIAGVPNLATHPAITLLKKYKTTFEKFKEDVHQARALPTSSRISPNRVKPFLMEINSIAIKLEPYLNPFLMEWIAKELRTEHFPNVISSRDLYGSAKYGNNLTYDNLTETLDCNSTILINSLQKIETAKSLESYNLGLINDYIHDLGQNQNTATLSIYPINSQLGYSNIFSDNSSDYINVLVAGNLLRFKSNDEWGNNEKGPRYKIGHQGYLTTTNIQDLSSVPTTRATLFKQIEKNSTEFIADSLNLLQTKMLSLSAIQYQTLSRNIVYHAQCGDKKLVVTPMQVLKHNATYRLSREWQARIAISSDEAFLLQEMNKILAEKRYMDYLLNRQKDQLIAVSNTMISTNQASVFSSIQGQKATINNDMNSYLNGQSGTDSNTQKVTEKASSATLTGNKPPPKNPMKSIK
ncbi:MAG TPA: hypothetical protein QF353_03510 [Gammaproteobacteria bacterium]|nr:hypothetical protein [Gammaproteobacteria bacterium]